MLENGAPPVKFGVLCCLLHTEIHGFNNNIDMVNTLRFLVLSQFFCGQYGSLEGLGDILLPNFSALHCSLDLCHSTSWSYFFPVVDYVGVHTKITTQINAVNTVTMIKVRFYWLSCFLRNCFLYVVCVKLIDLY